MNPRSTSVRISCTRILSPTSIAFETMHQFPFDRRMKKTDPRAFGGRTRDDGIEPVPDSWLEQYCRCGFFNLPFDLIGRILFLCAVFTQRLQILFLIGYGMLSHRSLQQPLGDEIRVSAVRGCGMGIVPDSETKVSRGAVSPGKSATYSPGSHKFDNRKREVGES